MSIKFVALVCCVIVLVAMTNVEAGPPYLTRIQSAEQQDVATGSTPQPSGNTEGSTDDPGQSPNVEVHIYSDD